MSDLYYDPWDVEIDLDPYPTYRRLRDGQPLIYNERHDFWGLSRYADVDAALRDPNRLSSAKGDLLEVVKTDPVIPEHASRRRAIQASRYFLKMVNRVPGLRTKSVAFAQMVARTGDRERLLAPGPISPETLTSKGWSAGHAPVGPSC